MSCLITDPIEFGQTDLPPSLRMLDPASPLERVSELTERGECGDQRVGLEYELSDPNVNQKLYVSLAVNEIGAYIQNSVPPEGVPRRGARSLCIELDDLDRSCNIARLMASGSPFEIEQGSPQAADANDMDELVWLLLGSEAGEGALEECLQELAVFPEMEEDASPQAIDPGALPVNDGTGTGALSP